MSAKSPTPAKQIERAIRARGGEQGPALVAFLTAGFPKRESFADHLTALCREADVVEIGVPFSDPMADGATIQRASREALAQGVSLPWILDELTALRGRLQAPVLLMSYLNPLLAQDLDEVVDASAEAGVAGMIVPDLPLAECAPLRTLLDASGLALVQLVSPVTPGERLGRLCEASAGFVYAVTVTGITGGAITPESEITEYLQRVREASPLPVCAGFGIRGRSQVAALAPYVDGVVVGSALVEALERGEDPAAFIASLRLGEGER